MGQILDQLGVNWRLLLTQGVNFFVLFTVLYFFLWRPLVKIMAERRQKIEFGLKGATEAEKRLNEIEKIKEGKLAEADKSALGIISEAESEAKKRAQDIVAESHKRGEALLKEAEAVAGRRREEQFAELAAKSNTLVRAAIAKTVELDPKAIDEKLVARAVEMIKTENRL